LIEDYFAHMDLHIQMIIDRRQKTEKSKMTYHHASAGQVLRCGSEAYGKNGC
jgi:hypothetical protein